MAKFDTVMQAKLLARLEQGDTITEACRHLGIARGTVYGYYREHPEYKSAMNDAKEASVDALLSEARARALDRDDPKSATMLIFLIKGALPQYKEGWKGEITLETKKSKALDFSTAELNEALGILQTAKQVGVPENAEGAVAAPSDHS